MHALTRHNNITCPKLVNPLSLAMRVAITSSPLVISTAQSLQNLLFSELACASDRDDTINRNNTQKLLVVVFMIAGSLPVRFAIASSQTVNNKLPPVRCKSATFCRAYCRGGVKHLACSRAREQKIVSGPPRVRMRVRLFVPNVRFRVIL